MLKDWYTGKELAGLPGMPSSKPGVALIATKENWQTRIVAARGGQRREYHITSLPQETRVALAVKYGTKTSESNLTETDFSIANPGAKAGLDYVAEKEKAHAKAAKQKEADIREFAQKSEKAKNTALARLEILKEAERFLKVAGFTNRKGKWNKSGVESFLKNLPAMKDNFVSAEAKLLALKGVAYVTLWRWRVDFKNHDLLGLCPSWKAHNQGTSRVTQEVKEFVIAHMYQSPGIDPNKVHRLAKARFRDVCSPSSIFRFMTSWKKNNAMLLLSATNPDKYRQGHMACIGEADADVLRLNQRWEMDSTPADIMCTDGRYTILASIEVFSRRVRMLVAPTSKAAHVASLTRKCLMAWGIPEEIKSDNGTDYVSSHIRCVLDALSINHIKCPPFSPDKKPHIESFFKTFSHDLLELQPGFIGHSVADRKAIEARKSFAKRLFEKDGEVLLNCTSEELQAFCDKWVDYYHGRPHSGLGGRTPTEAARAWTGGAPQTIENERALDILLFGGRATRMVRKQRIILDNRKFADPFGCLAPWEGREVTVYPDPSDLGRILVYGEDRRSGGQQYICWAQDPKTSGMDPVEFASRVRKHQNEYMNKERKALRKIAKEAAIETATEEFFAYHAEKRAAVIELPRPRGEVYTTPRLKKRPKPPTTETAFGSRRSRHQKLRPQGMSS